MAGTNFLYPFATGSGSNVLSNASYAALTARLTGFQAGTASSAAVNSVLRQVGFVTSMIGQFTADYSGQDVPDDGNVPAFEANFRAAVLATAATEGIYYGRDTGSADALAILPQPAATSYYDGMVIAFLKGANANATTSPQINVSNLGLKAILNARGQAPAIGDLVGATISFAVYDGTLGAFRRTGLTTSELLALIAANPAVINTIITNYNNTSGGYVPIFFARTYYVNNATGSDSNNGLTTGTAFATGNAAIAAVSRLNLNGNSVTIQFADAPSSSPHAPVTVAQPFFGGAGVLLQGNVTTPNNCWIGSSSGSAIYATNGAILNIQGFGVACTDSSSGCVTAQNLAAIFINGPMVYGAAAYWHIGGLDGGQVRINASYAISSGGGCVCHLYASGAGRVLKYGTINITVTATVPLASSTAFASAVDSGIIFYSAVNFVGTFTGPRYALLRGGRLNTSGLTLPGSTAGTLDSTSSVA